MMANRAVMLVKRVTYCGNLAIWTVHALHRVLFQCFWVPRKINSRFCSKTQWQVFLLVSGGYVGVNPHRLQHGVSIQISLGESLCISTFILFPDSGLILLSGFDFFNLLCNLWVSFSLSYKLLFLGHRSLIKKITQTVVLNIVFQPIFFV